MTMIENQNAAAQSGGGEGAPALFLSPHQLAERWQVTRDVLARMRMGGRGPAWVKIGGAVRYPVAAVIAYEAELVQEGAA